MVTYAIDTPFYMVANHLEKAENARDWVRTLQTMEDHHQPRDLVLDPASWKLVLQSEIELGWRREDR